MPLYPAVSDDLSQLLIDTAEQLAHKLPNLTAGLVSGSGFCAFIPTDLKADQHWADPAASSLRYAGQGQQCSPTASLRLEQKLTLAALVYYLPSQYRRTQ